MHMDHIVYKIVDFDVIRPYMIHVKFDDGVESTVDLEGVLEGEVYSPLKDPRLFERVELDPEIHTLVWPNGADFDPETLHEWPKYAKSMRKMAKKWMEEKPMA